MYSTDVKLPKQAIINISMIVIAASIVILFILYFSLIRKPSSIFFPLFGMSIIILNGWCFPVLLYLKQPQKIIFSDTKLTLINRINKEQVILRKNIHRLEEIRDIIDKKKIFNLYYDKRKPDYRINFDEESGKIIYDWYHNQGEWEKEVKQSENTPTSGEK